MSRTLRDVHIGIIVDNDDEEQRGRVKVASATLCGIDDNGDPLEYPVFIDPVYPVLFSSDGDTTDGGWFFIPSVGTFVEIVVAAESSSDSVPGAVSLTSGDVRWRACIWPQADAGSVPEEFKTNYPERRGIKTQRGHFLLFDDTEGDEKVSMECLTDAGVSFMSFDKTGSATLLTSGKNMVSLDDTGGTITILQKDSQMMSFGPTGIDIISKNSNMFTIDDSANSMNIMAQTSITLQCTDTVVNSNLTAYNSSALAASFVIKQGDAPAGTPFASALQASLTELVSVCTAMGIPAPNATAMASALAAGQYTSTTTKTE
jgi:hypothetical protein